jgi:formylglycine-generating enzyme required for sulfatase activity
MIGTPLDNDLNPPKFAGNELEGEMPAHEVEITQGFWIDKYEVTNASFQQFIDEGGYTTEAYWSEAGWKWLQSQAKGQYPVECKERRPDHPRACVTWFEAEAYAKWRGGQLPTEAQWEYSARGPESFVYPWGNEFDETKTNLVKAIGTKPVGSFPGGASWVGAHDMAGNVMEWVQDWYSVTYRGEQVKVDPPGPEKGNIKIEKGGWWGGPSPSYIGRSAYRHFEDPPGYQDHHIGFRIVSNQP